MYNIEDFDIESELLHEYWELINEVYGLAAERLKKEEENVEDFSFESTLFNDLYELFLHHWKKIYPAFVLYPKKEEILSMFLRAQNSDLYLKSPSKSKTKIYSVHYYIAQYFSITVEPYHEYDVSKFPNIQSKDSEDLNMLLYEIFEEIFEELELEEETGEGIFDDKTEFYDAEVEFLTKFLAQCWNETKSKTKTNAVAVRTESTAIGDTVLLDDDKKLGDFADEINIF